MQLTGHDLPERLELPLRTGEAWWYWLGGRPALDLVNTQRERWRRRVETLVTPDDLALWLVRADLLAEPRAVPAELLYEARELREAIDLGVRAAVAGERVPPDAVALIDRWLVHAATRPRLALGPAGRPILGRAPLAVGDGSAADPAAPRRALGVIALDAARMLGTAEEAARVRICASETCSARFYDRSPAARRRWCSMAACGNEAKARRHRARRRKTTHSALEAR
jgi:predicted RNA-binding Zn ribbon-like protein